MLIEAPRVRVSVDARCWPLVDMHLLPSGDAHVAGSTQGADAQGVSIDEGTHLAEVVEAAYDGAAPPLFSNEAGSFLLLCIFRFVHVHTALVIIIRTIFTHDSSRQSPHLGFSSLCLSYCYLLRRSLIRGSVLRWDDSLFGFYFSKFGLSLLVEMTPRPGFPSPSLMTRWKVASGFMEA